MEITEYSYYCVIFHCGFDSLADSLSRSYKNLLWESLGNFLITTNNNPYRLLYHKTKK